MADNYSIAASGGTVTNLTSLPTPVIHPKGFYYGYQAYADLPDGSRRGLGFPVAEWHWDFISRAGRDVLRTYCTGTSAAVDIRTRTNDSADSYGYFHAVMNWPEEEELDAGRRLDFVIRFTHLVAYTLPS